MMHNYSDYLRFYQTLTALCFEQLNEHKRACFILFTAKMICKEKGRKKENNQNEKKKEKNPEEDRMEKNPNKSNQFRNAYKIKVEYT